VITGFNPFAKASRVFLHDLEESCKHGWWVVVIGGFVRLSTNPPGAPGQTRTKFSSSAICNFINLALP
jgi:hypothetical protein